jgi:hypothetical protein
LRQHEPGATQDRGIVLLSLLASLPSLALLVVTLKGRDRRCLLAHEVDHERHREVIETMAPRDFHDNVKADELVAGIEHAHVAFATANVDKLQGWSVYVKMRMVITTYVTQELFYHVALA